VPLYYHYTDKVGYNGIMRNPTSFLDRISSMLSPRQSPTFNPSTGDSGDAHYGDGFYFTDLDPETYSRVQVARALAARGENHRDEQVPARTKDEILSPDGDHGPPTQRTSVGPSSASSVDTVSQHTKHGRRRP
jgi:hypothetical protein